MKSLPFNLEKRIALAIDRDSKCLKCAGLHTLLKDRSGLFNREDLNVFAHLNTGWRNVGFKHPSAFLGEISNETRVANQMRRFGYEFQLGLSFDELVENLKKYSLASKEFLTLRDFHGVLVKDSVRLEMTTPNNIPFVLICFKKALKIFNSFNGAFVPIRASLILVTWLLACHPFADGNGRICRVVLNAICSLPLTGYFPFSIPAFAQGSETFTNKVFNEVVLNGSVNSLLNFSEKAVINSFNFFTDAIGIIKQSESVPLDGILIRRYI